MINKEAAKKLFTTLLQNQIIHPVLTRVLAQKPKLTVKLGRKTRRIVQVKSFMLLLRCKRAFDRF